MSDATTIFGIRHHGPGSARSLLHALEKLEPDLVLVEGPPEADDLLELASDPELKPPVALLIYDPDVPRRAAFYPFAVYSPEWQAIQFARRRDIPVRFMDLPHAHRLARALPEAGADEGSSKKDEPEDGRPESDAPVAADTSAAKTAAPLPLDDEAAALRRDPLLALARIAGFEDSERWWDHLVESRRGGHAAVFDAVADAMQALRERPPGTAGEAAAAPSDSAASAGCTDDEQLDACREAWMRKTIRAALKAGPQRIAVVCGAWHVPALREHSAKGRASADNALLKGLPKTKTAAAWVPWSYERLARDSGYGAGVTSPEWYHLLWSDAQHIATVWLTRAARLMRTKDLDISSGHVIEAVRLAETLATLRGRALPTLDELDESALSIYCGGFDAPMALIRRRLVIGERLGHVPESAPLIPLQADLQRQQKAARLAVRTVEADFDLDLRKPLDLDRSRLLHRVRLLGIEWGVLHGPAGRTKGTFHERWRVQWDPAFVVRLVEAGRLGNTVSDAATASVAHAAEQAGSLSRLTTLLEDALLAELPDAVTVLLDTIAVQTAVGADVPLMMDALPPLARVTRYGNVRQTDAGLVMNVVRGLVERVCIGLVNTCAALDDEAARAMFRRLTEFHAGLALLEDAGLKADWLAALQRLADQGATNGIVTGRACRILHDQGVFKPEETGRRLHYALSQGNDPLAAAAWVEGLLAGSGQLLIHDEQLWKLVADWVASLQDATFDQVLPLLRRTFATFAGPERRQMGQRVKRSVAGPATNRADRTDAGDFDYAKAHAVLPVLAQILGVKLP